MTLFNFLGVNPHLLKRELQEREGYVWLAAFNHEQVISSFVR